ncbi:MAG: hypothetical protein L0346_17600 [Chloroflexi bacterium]|nr:hypothetical protein [Chloroflexota bacterium]
MAKTTSRRPLILILGGLGLALVLVAAGIAAGASYFLVKWTAAPEYVAQTACDHPYFPLRHGATWDYAGDIVLGEGRLPATATWTVEQVHGDETEATAIVIVIYHYDENTPQITETIAYSCTPGGIFRHSLIATARAQSFSQYATQSGAYLLSPAELVPGASWQYLYNIVTDYTLPGTDYAWSYEASAIETIDNTAGTFDAIRVEGSRSQPAGSDSSTEWFAFGVGQVRSERVQNEGGVEVVSTMALTGYRVPSP